MKFLKVMSEQSISSFCNTVTTYFSTATEQEYQITQTSSLVGPLGSFVSLSSSLRWAAFNFLIKKKQRLSALSLIIQLLELKRATLLTGRTNLFRDSNIQCNSF